MGKSTRPSRNPPRSHKKADENHSRRPRRVRGNRSGGRNFGRTVLVLAVLSLSCAAVIWAVRRADRPPTVVVPDDLESLDPQTKAYLSDQIAWVREDPLDPDGHATLGQVYFANGLWNEAIACLLQVAQMSPDHNMADYYAAVAMAKMGRREESKKLLRSLLQRDDSFAPAHHRLGAALLEEGATDDAAAAFQLAIDHAAELPAGYVGMAEVKIRKREYAQALTLLQKAFERKTTDRTAHYLLGLAYRGLGRQEEAKRALTRGSGATRQFMPNPWTAQINKHRKGVAYQIRTAKIHLQAKQPDKAIEVLETALAWHPENVEILNNLAIAHMESQRFEKARELLLRAEALGGNAAATTINLAACYLGQGDLEAALQYANRAIELMPTFAQAFVTKAQILLRVQQPDKAVAMLEKAVGLDEENMLIRFDLAGLYMAMGRPADAKEHYETVAERKPRMLPAHLRLCEVCLRLGDWEEAQSALAKAQRIAPNHQRVQTMTNRVEQLRPE